jgi:hypothetical protein
MYDKSYIYEVLEMLEKSLLFDLSNKFRDL